MFRFKSILSRIMFLHVTAIALTAIVMPAMLYWLFAADVESLQQEAVRWRADTLARHLVLKEDRWSLDLPAGLRNQYSAAYGRYFYAIIDGEGAVIFSSRGDQKPIFNDETTDTEIEFFGTSRDNSIIYGGSLHRNVDGHPILVQVAENLAHRDVLLDDVVGNFIPKVAWVTIPILLLLLASDFVIFRRAIQPLLRASREAAHISPARIDVRLSLENIPREIAPLVIAINHALDRLETGFRQQREFTADAAHELRTPLAILRTRIETWPDKNIAQALRNDLESMGRVVNQLLDAAELETATVDPNDQADLQKVCMHVAEFVAPIALAQEKAVALSGAAGPVWVKGNDEMIQRAITNLVENALKHTPRGTDVEIVVEEKGKVSVLDEGEGILAANRKKIFERFWRKDRRGTEGAGLGLSIVKRIVEAHEGAIHVENRPHGGASFSIQFPLAANLETPAS